jgi:hypothetical protein
LVPSTRKKLDGPARNGVWGARCDRLAAPSAVTLLKFADKSRHTRAEIVVGTVAFSADLDALAEAFVGAGVPSSRARALARDLLAKVNSPRAGGTP